VVRIPIGIPANFRALTTSMPGTWSGGTRTIPGVSPGEVVQLQVRVWDKNHYVSFEAARSCGYLAGESRIFDYTYSPSTPEQPTDKEMKNFLGFVVTQPLSPCYWGNPPPPPPHLIPVTENEDTAIVPPGDFTYGTTIWIMRVIEGSQTNRLSGSALGQVAIKGDDWVYRPNPFSYGIEEIGSGFCCKNDIVYATFEISPSPRRPYLDIVIPDADGPHSILLRGLSPKRCRIEQSGDLGAWTPVGECTANTSEVPVRELTDDGPEDWFFRAAAVLP
jgi:hypothetical protein